MRYVKSDFSKGIVSPAVQANIYDENYAKGLKNAQNMIVLPGGGIANRPGTEYVAEQKDLAYNSRMIDFIYGDDSYVIELGHLYIRLFKNGVQIESGGSPLEVVTTYDGNDLSEINYIQSGNVIYFSHVKYQQKTLTRTDDTTWTFADYEYVSGPFMPINEAAAETITPSGVTGNITLTSISNLFSNVTDAKHSSGRTLWQLNEVIPAQHITATIAATATTTSTIKCGGTWRIITHGTWTGTLQIEISSDGGTTWNVVRYLSSASGTGSNFDTYGIEDNGYYTVRVVSSGTWTGTAIVDFSTDLFLWKGYVQIIQVPAGGGGSSQLYNTADATVIDELASTTATNDWAEGSWSAVRGYPRAINFYQDRLCFGGSISEPSTAWLSETGFYQSFKRHSPLLDSDGISIVLPDRTVNDIRHFVSIKELLVLTSSGEHSIFSDTGIITPTTIQTKSSGYSGCSKVRPVVIGNRVVYVDSSGSGIRDTGYNFEKGGFNGRELHNNAPQLFEGKTIVGIAYQRNPFPIIWCIRSDGKLLSLTYTEEGEMLGWSYHETQEGSFKHLCVVQSDGFDEVWFMVDRPWFESATSGSKRRYIEKLGQRSVNKQSYDQKYSDCHTNYISNSVYIETIEDNGGNLAIKSTGHGFSNGDKIKIFDFHSSLDCLPNGNYYTLFDVAPNYFRIYLNGTTDEVSLALIYSDIINNTAYNGDGLVYETVEQISNLERFYKADAHPAQGILTVVGDGANLGGILGGGYIVTLQKPVSMICYGQAIDYSLELLPPVSQLNNGSMIGVKYAIKRALVRLNDTIGSQVGYDYDNLLKVREDANGNLFGKQSELITAYSNYFIASGDGIVGVGGTYNTHSSLVFSQPEPFPFEILLAVMFIDIGGE
ncbi:MAG: hypothetical protein GY797_33390 [Deltaproteobacteria bacterium]|nr:hypothetical protein [Deltaproteobacteria bacterium]